MHFFLYVGVEKFLRSSKLLHGWAKGGSDSWDGGLSKGQIRSDCLVPWSVPMSVLLRGSKDLSLGVGHVSECPHSGTRYLPMKTTSVQET